ncbi:hypothetical protein PLESTB_001183500 [Pleodorina starrii]|uniref:Uncharacterized protein n=1 Tax=Pleodorina starrii TaxID=330485 RepID=A0A9W6BRF9_9CHLO|nr:hypothetical protein PLESTM_000259600 [Pleodorina starrii]GLC57101.1 hypothetical protein PLESTB_001183500 [Pleodorina starrii]GLC64936.1 hypothetical protein PLESTF_000223800 [Pleodorina starrii]
MVSNGILHSLIEWWLGVLRVATLLALSPLLLPALALRYIGSGTSSAILTMALVPFMLMWVAAKTGYRFFRALASTLLTLPYEIVVAPYRFLRLLTKPHSMSGTQWSP